MSHVRSMIMIISLFILLYYITSTYSVQKIEPSIDEMISLINSKIISEQLLWNKVDAHDLRDMSKHKLHAMIDFNVDDIFDFKTDCLQYMSVDQYYTLYDILYYCNHRSHSHIINRHPFLFSYAANTILLQDERRDDIHTAIIKSIDQNLNNKYLLTISMNELYATLEIDIGAIHALTNMLNNLTLFSDPLINYTYEEICDTDLKHINSLIMNMNYDKNILLMMHKCKLSKNQCVIIMDALYKRTDIQEINMTSAMVNYMRLIVSNTHTNIPYDVLMTKIHKNTKLEQISDLLMYGY